MIAHAAPDPVWGRRGPSRSIALDSRYSVLAGLLTAGEDERIAALLEHLGFRIWHPALARLDADGRPAILRGLAEFREHLGGQLTVTLLTAVGAGHEVHQIDTDLMLEAAEWLRAREDESGFLEEEEEAAFQEDDGIGFWATRAKWLSNPATPIRSGGPVQAGPFCFGDCILNKADRDS